MRTRDVLLDSDYTLSSDSGTRTQNIDVTDPIAGITVVLRGTNGATSNKASPASHCITKIEIVDGGQVLYSMPGLLQRGLISHLTGVTPHTKISEIGGDSQYCTLPLWFGRYQYDPTYAFNPTAFLNPQIKVTYNLAAVNAVGATGFTTGSGRLTIALHVLEDVEAPLGFLSSKEYENFTSAASGDYISELPVDRVWRTMLVRAYEAGTALNSSLTNLKLSFDGGSFMPFNQSIPKFWRQMVTSFGPITSEVLAQADNGTAYENWLAFVIGGAVNGRSSGVIATVNSHDNSQTSPYLVNHAGTAQTGTGVWTSLRGTSLENCVVIPFGDINKPETWLSTSQWRNAKLYLTQGNAGATCNVALQELYTY